MSQRSASTVTRRPRARRQLVALGLLGLAAAGASPLSSGTAHEAPHPVERVAVAGR